MLPDLSPTMLGAYNDAKAHGGKLFRFPGGYWRTMQDAGNHHGTSTIQALVNRGVAIYSSHREGRNGLFPVEITLTPEKDHQK